MERVKVNVKIICRCYDLIGHMLSYQIGFTTPILSYDEI
jgi:hypothetical protein